MPHLILPFLPRTMDLGRWGTTPKEPEQKNRSTLYTPKMGTETASKRQVTPLRFWRWMLYPMVKPRSLNAAHLSPSKVLRVVMRGQFALLKTSDGRLSATEFASRGLRRLSRRMSFVAFLCRKSFLGTQLTYDVSTELGHS